MSLLLTKEVVSVYGSIEWGREADGNGRQGEFRETGSGVEEIDRGSPPIDSSTRCYSSGSSMDTSSRGECAPPLIQLPLCVKIEQGKLHDILQTRRARHHRRTAAKAAVRRTLIANYERARDSENTEPTLLFRCSSDGDSNNSLSISSLSSTEESSIASGDRVAFCAQTATVQYRRGRHVHSGGSRKVKENGKSRRFKMQGKLDLSGWTDRLRGRTRTRVKKHAAQSNELPVDYPPSAAR